MIFDALKLRLRASLARPAQAGPDLAAAGRHAAALTAEGAWTDIDYGPAGLSRWAAVTHLERVLLLARAREGCEGGLDAALASALDYWLGHDWPAPDAWHHQIVVPRLVGSAAFLCEDLLSPGAQDKVAEILARPRWTRWRGGAWQPWSGTDLVAVAFNVVLRGCLAGVAAWCQEAFERVYSEVKIAPPGEDGIQADMSFLHRNPSASADRYGLVFSENCARFLVLGHGTAWQAPAPCLALLASFLLDGQQWMIRRRFFDAGFPDGSDAPLLEDLDGLALAVEELGALGTMPRRVEMAALARRLRVADAPALGGHRHFWRAGLVVHQRPAFYTSVRTGGDTDQSVDGLTCILRRGDEYSGHGLVWDRRRLPGTTALQTVDSPGGHVPVADRRGRVGGVTDGEYGVSLVEMTGRVSARKAWFHFNESVVCLGSGIACEDASGPVFTSLNQCRARGGATAYGKGGETHVLAPGKSYDLSAAHRLEHDEVLYHFPEPSAVRGRIAPQAVPRPEVGSDTTVHNTPEEMFSLWIDHGTQPRHESYAYTVLPAADPDGHRATDHEVSQIEILANTPAAQAVWHRELHLVGIVFWEPGVIDLPAGGRVAVNRSCVLLGQDRRPDGVRLSIANPSREDATVHVEFANRCLCFNLPAGPRGGQSVNRVL